MATYNINGVKIGELADGENSFLVNNVSELLSAVDIAEYGQTINIANGTYEIDSTLQIPYGVSVKMNQYAKIVASESFVGDYVLKYYGDGDFEYNTTNPITGGEDELMGLLFSGGIIDAQGKAGCFSMGKGMHITIENMTFLNPKTAGLNVGNEGFCYETIVKNCYARTFVNGCEGNIGFCINAMDNHFVDCITQDVTTAFKDNQGSNRFTRCHIWGGRLGYPNSHPMLNNSIGFDLSSHNTLTDCYADTSAIGIKINGTNNVIIGANCFNNYSKYGLDNIVLVDLNGNGTKFIGCDMRTGGTPHYTLINNPNNKTYEAIACIGFPNN